MTQQGFLISRVRAQHFARGSLAEAAPKRPRKNHLPSFPLKIHGWRNGRMNRGFRAKRARQANAQKNNLGRGVLLPRTKEGASRARAIDLGSCNTHWMPGQFRELSFPKEAVSASILQHLEN